MQNLGARIKALRERQRLTQRALAEAAGISPAALSLLESGQNSPSVATLEKLAGALGIAITAFFLEDGEEVDIEVLDLDERPSVPLRRGGRFVPLSALRQPTGLEPMLVQLEPGGRFEENQYGIKSPDAFVWIRKGRAVLEYDGRNYALRETQSVYYDARKPHTWRNVSDSRCELLMVRSR